jgi:exosortase D (VPLPA-CTERM-specific)
VDFGNLLKRWDSEDFSYCYLVPMVFLYLVYTNRKSIAEHRVRPSLSGILVLIAAGALYLGGRRGSIETLSYVAIWLSIVGVTLLLLGTRILRVLTFPFLILAFIVPLPPFLNNLFTFRLKLISSALSVKMMQLAGISVFREGNIIDLGVTQLQVVDACSGLRYVYPLLLMGLIFAYLFHKKWWERIVIILATVPISVVSNALRIAITGYLTIHVSAEAAEGFFHGFSGWLIFMVSFVFLAVLSWIIKFLRSRLIYEVPTRVGNPNRGIRYFDLGNARSAYLWIAAIFFVGFWGLNAALASSQITPERRPFKTFPIRVGDWVGEKTYLNEKILKSLWADDYVQVHYKNQRTGDFILLFVPYYEYQKARHTAHAPEACLIGGGYAPRSRRVVKKVFPAPFGEVRIGQMVLEKNRQQLLSNYWFQGRGRVIASAYMNKWYLFVDAVTRRRTDGALVRIEMPVRPGQSVEEAQAVVDRFTREIMKILPEYVPG